MFRLASALAALSLVATPAAAQPKPDEAAFRALYKELVETNTTVSSGSCTLAAERMAARLKAAGFPEANLTLFTPDGFPKDGGLVATLPGRDPKAKAILLLAHIDVVEARREDWARDPFVLVEEDGYFYGRGSLDDKSQAAVWVDSLIRYHREGYRPRKPIKMALTCGEESGGRVNGVDWLIANRRDLIDAEFGLNEGGYGEKDSQGRRVALSILAAEKSHVAFRLEVTNPGGHSSMPVPDNAIYHLARALDAVSRHEFPVRLNDANRAYFTRMSKIVGGETGQAMAAIVADPADKAADALLSKNASYHAMLRTTCVATQLEGGHAVNALPQRARATLSCRIIPGETAAEVRQALVAAIADPQVSVSEPPAGAVVAPPLTLTPRVLGPVEKVTAEMWPGVPVVPFMFPAATDARRLAAAGVPVYGVTGIFNTLGDDRAHGLNERISVRSLLDSRDFLYRLVKLYADQKP